MKIRGILIGTVIGYIIGITYGFAMVIKLMFELYAQELHQNYERYIQGLPPIISNELITLSIFIIAGLLCLLIISLVFVKYLKNSNKDNAKN